MNNTSVVTHHEGLLHLTERLILEYRGALPAGSVMGCVAKTYHDLVAAGVPHDIAVTEEVTRRRLVERAALRAV